MQLPKLKKKVHAFLTSEEGKISKETIIKAGAIAVLATQAVSAQTTITDHTNSASIKTDQHGRVYGEHTHSPYHANHSSHSSHGSGGGWW